MDTDPQAGWTDLRARHRRQQERHRDPRGHHPGLRRPAAGRGAVVVEGEEEAESHLPDFVRSHPELFGCDLIVVADTGSPAVGEPALTGALRGEVSCIVRVRALERQVHSGRFGGPVPDGLLALARVLTSLHGDRGDVAVAGLRRGEWTGGDLDAGALRAGAGIRDGVGLVGSGTVASRLWAMPWGVEVTVERGKVTPPVEVDPDGPGILAARRALEEAFGRPAAWIGSGGSIQLVSALREVAERAEVVLWGAEDFARANIHVPNESVDPVEVQRYALAQALLIQRLAAGA